MSVEVGRPTIRLTDNAVAKLKEMLAEQEDTKLCLRVFIQSGGCDGYSYGMTFDSPEASDEVIEKGGVRLLVDAASSRFLRGSEIDYVTSVGKPRIRAHETELARYAHERLREINSLRIFGTARDKGPIVSFELKGSHPHDVATIIDRAGVAVRAGTHCVMPLLARYGVTATCRASFAMYNTREEVDCLAQALLKAQNLLG